MNKQPSGGPLRRVCKPGSRCRRYILASYPCSREDSGAWVVESRKHLDPVPAPPMFYFLSLTGTARKLQAEQFSSIASGQIIHYLAFKVKCRPRDLEAERINSN